MEGHICLLYTSSKESIFTGLNNLKVLSIADVQFGEYFGFTDEEVREMLEYYELSDHYEDIREWYDGYQFGKAEVYCPWDVINYVDTLRADPLAEPKNYWSNTSSNEAVKRFIRESDKVTPVSYTHLVAVDLPGFKKDEIQLELNDGYLTISAEKGLDKEEKDKKDKYIRRERYAGSMSRTFYVGESVTENDIHAKYENGILTLDVPKEEAKKVPEKRYISIEG